MSLKIESLKKLRKLKKKIKTGTWEEYNERENELYKQFFQGKEPTILGKLNIVAGEKKNFTLEIPRNTRPLTNRLKLTVFDILGTDILKKRVLDLFAGSGSFGFEALSRGAKECTFVDAAKSAEKVLLINSKKTGYLTNTEIIRQKADEFLIQKNKEGKREYDIIFIDPPYKIYNTKDRSKINLILNEAFKLLPGVKKPDTKRFKGAMIVKHPRQYDITKIEIQGSEKIETYDFGLNAVSIYIVKK